MIILGIDQSLSKPAFVILDTETNKVLLKTVAKTGDESSKGKKFETVAYFNAKEERIHYICQAVVNIMETFRPDYVFFEALAFGAAGNATRDLAEVMGAMTETMIGVCKYPSERIFKLSPTLVKSFARKHLPEEEWYSGETKAGKPKLRKMEKEDMIRAVKLKFGENYLDGFKCSGANAGADDIADATWIALAGQAKLSSEVLNED